MHQHIWHNLAQHSFSACIAHSFPAAAGGRPTVGMNIVRTHPSAGASAIVLAFQRDLVAGSITRIDQLDQAIVGCVGGLILVSAAMLATFGMHARLVSVTTDVVLDTVTTLVTVAIAVLAWARYRERGEPVALFQSGAFLILALANGLALIYAVRLTEPNFAVALASPASVQFGVATLARLAAAVMLVVGGVSTLRGWSPRHTAWPVLGAPFAFIVVTLALVIWPGAIAELSGRIALDPSGGPNSSWTSAPTPLGVAVQVLGAGLFLLAAALCRRLFRRDGAQGDGYLAVGLVFAAFAQMLFALDPGAGAGLVTGGDLFRLAFDVVLLFGIGAEVRGTLAALREANGSLRRFREAELDRAAQEERSRLSRELHDGLAQALWRAKLKGARLLSLELEPEARVLCEELSEAVDAGLAEARHAVMATHLSGADGAPLPVLLARYLDDFADRFGIRTEFDCDPYWPRLAARAEAEVLRIVQEATNNVRRHADASIVHVRAFASNGTASLTVKDDGHGFDPGAVGGDRYGLTSMRERALLVGGHLAIESSPRTGTMIRVDLPAIDVRTNAWRATHDCG